MKATAKDIADWLKGHDDIAILTHLHPDGDALGASIALALALRALNKRAFVCCQDDAPEFLNMLPYDGILFQPEEVPFTPGAIISVDCAARSRFGRAAALIRPDIDIACVDHHLTNDIDAQPSFIDAQAAASGELIAQIIDGLGVAVTGDMALCLFVAISTDTGHFSFSCTTPACLAIAARCLEAGLDVDELTYRLYRRRTAARTQLLGRALGGTQYHDGGQIALMKVSQADFAACGAGNADTEGIVNFGINTGGVEIAVLAVEQPEGVKISLRSRGRVNVAALGARFGGGGHERAAGITMPLPLDAAMTAVLTAARDMLK